MAVLIFENREQDYLDWIERNPSAYVMNSWKRRSMKYLVLHLASCGMVGFNKRYGFGACTDGDYIKVVSTDCIALEAWAIGVTGASFSKICKICHPQFRSTLLDVNALVPGPAFDGAVRISQRDSADARKARLDAAKTALPRYEWVTRLERVRNPDVVAEVLDRAGGICAKCGREAPFLRSKGRTPYLEVHHMHRLVDGGADTVENAQALCPECHRFEHHGLLGSRRSPGD